jgi:prepilin-type N-terminal cleavage/methylation domain-containing protein
VIFRNPGRHAAFTIVELLVAMGVFGVFSAALMTTWTALHTNAVNATAYAQRQNDQMRVADYLKRDIRRASVVEIYNGATLVTGTNSGTELRVTLPDYYADTREEDNAIGSRTPNAPTLSGTTVSYGGTMVVRYYVLNGAVIRDEAGTPRTIATAVGAFLLSFRREATGDVRSQVFYNQPMRGSGSRLLRRQLDVLGRPRSDLQL